MYADAVPQGVNATDAPKAAALKMGDRLLCDLHVTVCKLSHDRAGIWLNFFPSVPAISSCAGGHDGPVLPQLEGDGSISKAGGVARFQSVLSSATTGPQGWGAMVSPDQRFLEFKERSFRISLQES